MRNVENMNETPKESSRRMAVNGVHRPWASSIAASHLLRVRLDPHVRVSVVGFTLLLPLCSSCDGNRDEHCNEDSDCIVNIRKRCDAVASSLKGSERSGDDEEDIRDNGHIPAHEKYARGCGGCSGRDVLAAGWICLGAKNLQRTAPGRHMVQ